MGDISDIVPRYLNVETLLLFLANRGATAVEEWRRIISTGEISETQIKELQESIKVFMADATSAVVHAVKKKKQRMQRLARSPQREISDHRSPTALKFTDLSQLDSDKSQESSSSSLEVILIMDREKLDIRRLGETAIFCFRIATCLLERLKRDQ